MHRYVVVGGGAAAAAAAEGIRAHDPDGPLLVLSRDNHAPYRRAPLTRDVWDGATTLGQLPVHADGWYAEHGVDLRLRREVVELDAAAHRVWDERGESYEFEQLLLATGARPRRLAAEGADASGVRYFRDLEDYLDLEARLPHLQHLTVVGGGATAAELAGVLRARGAQVTLVLPEEYPLFRTLPRDLGTALADHLRELGVETVSGEALVRIEEAGGVLHARTVNGNALDTQLVLVDQGGEAQDELAEAAGLDTDDGVVVDALGHTSRPGVWAAGEVTEFPSPALGQLMRGEGVDHAERHGRCVGANMAGAGQPYDHLPRRAFRIGDQRFEGVGELSARLETETVWIEEGREGVAFYVRDDAIRGVLLVNVEGRLEWARELVRAARAMAPGERAALVGAKT